MPKRNVVGWLCGMLLFSLTARAQVTTFSLDLSVSTNQSTVGSTFSYIIAVTNRTAASVFGNVVVTNALPPSVTLIDATFSQGAISSSNNSSVIFSIGALSPGQGAAMGVVIQPNAVGSLTNSVTVSDSGITYVTNTIITTVTNAPRAVIEGTIKSQPTSVYVNDRIVFSTSFTNTGGATSDTVVISNFFSRGVLLRSVSPSNLVSAFNGTNLLLTAGSLAPSATGSFTFVVQPTNTGTLVTTATFTGSNLDTNSMAQSALLTNFVSDPDTNQLAAVFDNQFFDPQTGLFRLTVAVSNVGTSDVSSVRVVVMGLGTNRLFNAVGTNADNPFVVFGAPLPAGATTNIVLEYFVRSRLPLTNLTFIAYEANAPDQIVSPGESPIIVRVVPLTNPNRLLIEFQSDPGSSYAIVYADNASFTNAHMAQPAIVAPADRTQWIDDGPPKTISPLISTTNRFYRVIKQ